MNKIKWTIGSGLLGIILLFGISNVAIQAKSLFENESEKHKDGKGKFVMHTSAGQIDKTYTEECGSCHLSYPAGLLPKASWNKIMANLENHFDENAELDVQMTKLISTYLNDNAADTGRFGSVTRMLRNIPRNAPIRITKLPYFIRKHDEIPSKMVTNNPQVGSFSQCNKCHSGAEKGDFEEDHVKIPGYGRWED